MSTPELGSSQPKAVYEPPPMNQSRDIGWAIGLAAGIGLLVAMFGLFPTDADGMWAGYCSEGIAVLALVAVSSLRTTLPRGPAIGVLLLGGVGLVVLGLFQVDQSTTVAITEIVGGAALVVSGGLQTA